MNNQRVLLSVINSQFASKPLSIDFFLSLVLHRKRSDYTRIKCSCQKIICFKNSILFVWLLGWFKVYQWFYHDWTIYSATTFLEKYIKEVLEKWFSKLFFWSTTFLEPDFLWIYGIKPPFFLANHFSRTIFLEPDF